MWYVKAYFKLLFSKAVWGSWFVWLLIALSLYAVGTAEDMAAQAIRSTVCFVLILMFMVMVGMLMGVVQHKRGPKKEN